MACSAPNVTRTTPPSASPVLPAGPCVIDIEASGFGRSSYPIEVGYVLPGGRSVCMLIRPQAGWTHWDEAAQRVHGISRALLQTRGRGVVEVAQIMNADLHGRTVYCDGWAHDYPWLAAVFEAAGEPAAFRLESVNRLLDDARLSLLDGARQAARAELGLVRHRASNDARALQRALQQVTAGA